MTNSQNVATNLAQICLRAGVPLHPKQEVLIGGALAVWLEKVRREGMGAGLEQSDLDPMDVVARSATCPQDVRIACGHDADTTGTQA